MTAGLFPEPERAPEPPPDTRTAGQRRRDRFTAAIGRGMHPLSVPLRSPIRLHPDAQRALTVTSGPSCGTCTHRKKCFGGARDYPKCCIDGGWRATHGESTDVRAAWPGCDQWEK